MNVISKKGKDMAMIMQSYMSDNGEIISVGDTLTEDGELKVEFEFPYNSVYLSYDDIDLLQMWLNWVKDIYMTQGNDVTND